MHVSIGKTIFFGGTSAGFSSFALSIYYWHIVCILTISVRLMNDDEVSFGIVRYDDCI